MARRQVGESSVSGVQLKRRAPRPIHRIKHHLAPASALLLLLLGVAWPSSPAAQPPAGPSADEAAPTYAAGLQRDRPLRRLLVDLDALRLPGASGALQLSYDPSPHLAALQVEALRDAPAEQVAVRLVLSEIGVDRLLDNANGLAEAVALLQLVENRLTPAVADPLGARGYQPYPGCGPEGDFVSCANPEQFLALSTRRALRPAKAARPERLSAALDLAMLAWTLTQEQRVADLSAGATQFVHRCGGQAYGAPSTACDEPEERGAGAEAHSGPLLLRAPAALSPRGHYRLQEAARIHYRHAPGGPQRGAVEVLSEGGEDFAAQGA